MFLSLLTNKTFNFSRSQSNPESGRDYGSTTFSGIMDGVPYVQWAAETTSAIPPFCFSPTTCYYWWERSVYNTRTSDFFNVHASGSVDASSPNHSFCFSPAFYSLTTNGNNFSRSVAFSSMGQPDRQFVYVGTYNYAPVDYASSIYCFSPTPPTIPFRSSLV